MILVTGGTGFVGRSLLRALSRTEAAPVRVLIRPSGSSPKLPPGITMDAALTSVEDERGVRAAMVGVDTVIHLASEERAGGRADLWKIDVQGTRNVLNAAVEAGVSRFVFLSHVGANRSSAYPMMRAKAAAEEAIRQSGIPYTILRSSVAYGAEDRFTTHLAMQIAMTPIIYPLPGDGSTLLQPVWVEDLAIALSWILDEDRFDGETYNVGGPEFLRYEEIVQLVLRASGMTRFLLPMRQPYLRGGSWLLDRILRRPPVSPLWLDYLAVNRTAELDSLPSMIGLQPARMEGRLSYLAGKNWGWELIRRQFRSNGVRP